MSPCLQVIHSPRHVVGNPRVARRHEFLARSGIRTLPGTEAVLRSCEGILPLAEELGVVRCTVDAVELRVGGEATFPTTRRGWWAAELAVLSPASLSQALEAPREPRRPKVHWDSVLVEMGWLAKEFDSERKWKLSMAKKIAQRANKSIVDQSTKDERKQKEEHRMKKVALNISKDVKKFWLKIEKLIVYKHQLELEERKKKALDKQLDFLLGQTERCSTMLAGNLVDLPYPQKP